MHRFVKLVAAVVLLGWGSAGWSADDTWALRAEFVGLKPGNPAVAIFQLSDRTRIELPLAALSEGDREAIRRAVEAKPEAAPGGPLIVRGPLGRSVTLAVPEVLKAVETDAIWCATAADAVLVYQLFLAGDALSAAERSGAERRLAEWQKLAAEKRVRQGDAWVTPEQRSAVRREAELAVRKALQTLKLGNTKLFEDELEKASRLDPEDGRAEFIIGLGYAMSPGGAPKAIEHFNEAARRAPEDPWVFTNLAACEFVAGRFVSLPARYRQAFDRATDGRLVTTNLGAMLAAVAAMRSKMPERTVRELNDLYHRVSQAAGVKPGEGAAGGAGPGIAYASPYGTALPQGPVAGLPALLEPPEQWVAGGRFAGGVVVAPGLVLTSRRVLAELGEVWVEDPASPGRRLVATEVASLEEPEVTLLRCDGLLAAPLPLGEKMPVVAAEVAAANKVGGVLLSEPAELRRGALVSGPRTDLRGAFVHSAKLTRGLGGGPIVDATGRVVGLVAPTPRTDAIGNARGLGIPIEAIWPLLKEQLADLAPAEAVASPLAWEAIEARLAPATVRVVGEERRLRPKAE
jgi:tetratricopeptide (TPR) repeat protein